MRLLCADAITHTVIDKEIHGAIWFYLIGWWKYPNLDPQPKLMLGNAGQ